MNKMNKRSQMNKTMSKKMNKMNKRSQMNKQNNQKKVNQKRVRNQRK